MRINRYVSQWAQLSRREADRYIEEGRVKINKRLAQLGDRVEEGDAVFLDEKPLLSKPKKVVLAYNKPLGIECTTKLEVEANIVKAVGFGSRVFPIGRLDKFSEGLILLTNDGDLCEKICRPRNGHQKEYVVVVDQPINHQDVLSMSQGLDIGLEHKTMKCEVEQIGKNRFKIILKQGMNRQIRRMCESLGFRVVRLKRIRIDHIFLDELKKGEWRLLSEEEINRFLLPARLRR